MSVRPTSRASSARRPASAASTCGMLAVTSEPCGGLENTLESSRLSAPEPSESVRAPSPDPSKSRRIVTDSGPALSFVAASPLEGPAHPDEELHVGVADALRDAAVAGGVGGYASRPLPGFGEGALSGKRSCRFLRLGLLRHRRAFLRAVLSRYSPEASTRERATSGCFCALTAVWTREPCGADALQASTKFTLPSGRSGSSSWACCAVGERLPGSG